MHRLKPRLFVTAVAMVTVLAVLAGCATKPEPKSNSGPANGPAQTIVESTKESPMLAALVKEGKLPKLEDRLPKEPLVVKAEQVGVYGGTWRTATRGVSDNAMFVRYILYEPWVRWDVEWSGKVFPGTMSKFEASADAKTFTFSIREGLKWSDGHPVTTDDVAFMFDTFFTNKEVFPNGIPWPFRSPSNQPATFTKVDGRTFKIEMPEPSGLFLQNLAQPQADWADWLLPSHYLSQFFDKAKGDAAIQAMGVKDFNALMKKLLSPHDNPDLPVIYQFVNKVAVSSGKKAEFERNPYYWKVDQEGHQLPYIDRFVAEVYDDANPMVLKALNGEIDMQDRHINTNQNKAVFVDGQAKGNYHLWESQPTSMNTAVFALNLSHKDLELRKIFLDKRFRMALSYAINRKEAIDTLFVGQGEPWQAAPLKGTPYYDEQMAKQYTEYDVAKANQLLDEMGLTKKDSRGMRLRFDGKPLTITLEIPNNLQGQGVVDYGELLKKYFAAVGIDLNPKVEDRSLFYERKNVWEHDAGIWAGDGGVEVLFEARWYLPTNNESLFGTGYAAWFSSNGKEGVEPPDSMKKQWDLRQQIQTTGDPAKQEQLMKEILKIAKDEFWAIGLSLPVKSYGIVKNNFHNVPETMWNAWLWPHPSAVNTSTFFFSDAK